MTIFTLECDDCSQQKNSIVVVGSVVIWTYDHQIAQVNLWLVGILSKCNTQKKTHNTLVWQYMCHVHHAFHDCMILNIELCFAKKDWFNHHFLHIHIFNDLNLLTVPKLVTLVFTDPTTTVWFTFDGVDRSTRPVS